MTTKEGSGDGAVALQPIDNLEAINKTIKLPQFGIRNLKNTSMILLSFRCNAPWSYTSRG